MSSMGPEKWNLCSKWTFSFYGLRKDRSVNLIITNYTRYLKLIQWSYFVIDPSYAKIFELLIAIAQILAPPTLSFNINSLYLCYLL
jgi:hypothetical protein